MRGKEVSSALSVLVGRVEPHSSWGGSGCDIFHAEEDSEQPVGEILLISLLGTMKLVWTIMCGSSLA
jgi:hypothetical protein